MERNRSIDLLKGIGIVLMFIGHASCGDSLHSFIYSFHMPLFFVIAGYLYSYETTFPTILKRSAKRLLLPYWKVLLVCIFVFDFPYYNNIGLIAHQLKNGAYSICTLDTLPNCSPIWFLTCMFCVRMILFVFMRVNRVARIFMLMSLVIAHFICAYFRLKLPFNLDAAFVGTIFAICGLIIKKYEPLIFKNTYAFFSIIVFAISYYFLGVNVDMNACLYSQPLIGFFITGISMSFFLMCILRNRHCDSLEYIGRNSLFFMGYNYAIISMAFFLNNRIFHFNQWVPLAIVELAIATILCASLNRVQKIKQIII